MSCLPEEAVTRPLITLAMPGSHDSFAYELRDDCPVANDKSRLVQGVGRLRAFRRMIRRWATTQRSTVMDQLLAGVRYFDVRLTVPQTSKLDGIRVVHGLYGDRIEQYLVKVNEFLEDHPKEIVILDFNHLYDFDDVTYNNFLQILQNTFHSKLCPREGDLRKITLSSMWNTGYQVIAISANEKKTNRSTPWMWDSGCIVSPYANVNQINSLFEFLKRTLKEHCKEGNNVFYVTQAVLTAKWTDISFHPFSTLEQYCASKCTEETVKWIKKYDRPSNFNIIICDFVERFDFCETVYSLNMPSG